jgi:GTPase SAR1 family protein
MIRNINCNCGIQLCNEKYSSVSKAFYNGAHCFLIAFSLIDMKSFENINKWINNIYDNRTSCGNFLVVLVGTKNDMLNERVVSKEMVNDYIRGKDMIYFETSAKNNNNVTELFDYIGATLCRGYACSSR